MKSWNDNSFREKKPKKVKKQEDFKIDIKLCNICGKPYSLKEEDHCICTIWDRVNNKK